jgi:hypothetical protein
MDDEELEYLQPGFDLNTLKVANLRNILVKHDVEFPSSAKKAELIQLVTDGVLPKRKKLLAAHARVKRTSKGIIDVPSSQESTIDGDEEDKTLMPPPETPRRTGRRTTKIASMDGEDAPVETTARRVGRTPGRKSASVKHPRESDTDDLPESELKRPSSRKTRKSEVPTPALPPAVKIEEPDSPPRASRRISNFTTDNPFQSGSSPPADRDSGSKPRRRKSSSSASREERRKSTSRGRKTLSPTESKFKQGDGFKVPSRSTFEVPVSRLGTTKTEDMNVGIDAGEEFTPEEQLALVRDRAANGHQELLPPKRKKRSKKAGPVAKSAPWLVILTFLIAAAGYWRHEKIEIGYCGVGKSTWSLTETKVPQWAHGLQPECEPCPPHAYCHPNMEVSCEQDFILTQHPLSLGGLWPLPPTCEPDGEKGRRVQAVAARAIEELRERRAKWECGSLVDDKGKEVKVEMPEQELKKEVGKKRRRGMSEQEFEDLWQGALGEIMSRDEVISDSAGYVPDFFKSLNIITLLPPRHTNINPLQSD